MKFYNTLSKKIEEFKPISGKKVGFYACGPTVYDFAHIGNFRTYIFEDVLVRFLRSEGYEVKHVMNITDVDDKIIKRAKEEKTDIGNIASKFEKSFFEDLSKLNIEKADKYPRATENINEIIDLIQKLLEKKVAYKATDGIYFDISKFPEYGKLSNLGSRELKEGARVSSDQYDKENPGDFSLWKFPTSSRLRGASPTSPEATARQAQKRGEPFWDAPFGEGRPGWHIECSAMSMKYLGESFDQFGKLMVNGEHSRTIDIHAGAVDLIFPHHENEIAQAESATGKKFVNYWLEGEHLLVLGQKMSKSLNNFYTLRDLVKQGFNPLAFRYLCLTASWQKQLNFTWESLTAAQNALSTLKDQVSQFKKGNIARLPVPEHSDGGQGCAEYENEFVEKMEDNLNTPEALAVLWKLVKSEEPPGEKYKSIPLMDEILGLNLFETEKQRLPKGAKELIEKREKVRQEKDFTKSDELRKKLFDMGVEIEDTPSGPKWKLAK